MAGAGPQCSAALLGGVSGGQWLDRRVGTAPVFPFRGSGIGAIGVSTAVYRQLTRANREDEEVSRQ